MPETDARELDNGLTVTVTEVNPPVPQISEPWVEIEATRDDQWFATVRVPAGEQEEETLQRLASLSTLQVLDAACPNCGMRDCVDHLAYVDPEQDVEVCACCHMLEEVREEILAAQAAERAALEG